MKCHSNLLLQTPQGTSSGASAQDHRTLITILFPAFHLCVLDMLIIKHLVLANVKEVCIFPFYSLSDPRDAGPPLCFLLPPSSTTSGFHVTLLTSPPLILMWKTSCKTAILWGIFSICWDFTSGNLLKIWLRKPLVKLFNREDVFSLTEFNYNVWYSQLYIQFLSVRNDELEDIMKKVVAQREKW